MHQPTSRPAPGPPLSRCRHRGAQGRRQAAWSKHACRLTNEALALPAALKLAVKGFETGPLDSTALRLSWNPRDTLALQASWGHFTEPEQLEPGIDQKRLSASALYTRQLAPGWKGAAALAWGRKVVEHRGANAYAAQASLKHRAWTLFDRAELTDNRELVAGAENGPAFRVGKVSLGAVRDFRIAGHLALGAGVRGQLRARRACRLLQRKQPDGPDGLRQIQGRVTRPLRPAPPCTWGTRSAAAADRRSYSARQDTCRRRGSARPGTCRRRTPAARECRH
jgi:hypothetical protein